MYQARDAINEVIKPSATVVRQEPVTVRNNAKRNSKRILKEM